MQTGATWKKVNTHRENPELRELLYAWVAAIERYTTRFVDNPWCFNERATLSTLAGAAWTLKDWVALEEFATSKRLRKLQPGVDHGDKLRYGRCDLYVSAPNLSFAFEAKQAVQPIGGRANGYSYAYKAIDAAWHDIGDIQSGEADCRYAATFVVPTIPVSEIYASRGESGEISARKVRAILKAWLEETMGCLGKNCKDHEFAFIFPELGNPDYCIDGRHYPGVVLMLQERLRATKRCAA
ncbi:hypothetical protein [Pseudomonas putida]|uniref:hypothetical protein n=1 Tax=Pseudomonas putida TaxID=303 RepID=UPI001F525DF1|nr:hypothetical protein [Pseudomonas putida]MCI1037988.1 hypothetical protein [Pseudomonas putida]